MNRLFKFLGVVALVLAFTSAPNTKASAQFTTVSFQTFYDELSPYGNWINDPHYGYVWSPQVGGDFQPYYSGGRWAMTEYGNTWVSDYDWGWAPFHYGRWTFDNYYGWLWIPGNDWGPAWVSWRQGGGYYGWAPMGPGININVSFGNNYYVPDNWWVFVPNRHIYANSYGSYWRGPRYNNTIIYQTTVINNVYNNQYVCGPSRRDVERYTGGRVNIYNVRNENNPRGGNRITNNTVSIYRPTVIKRESGRNNIAEAPKNAVRTERAISRDNTASVRSDMRGNNSNRSNEISNRLERNRTQELSRDERMPSRFERGDKANTDRFRNQPQPAERNSQNESGFSRRENAMNENRTAMPERREPARQEMMERQQMERRQQQDLNAQRMEQYQAQRNRNAQMPQQQPRQERPQREWRRPEPQQQQQPSRMPEQRREPMQRMERSQPQQMERQQPTRQPQMDRQQSMPQQRNEGRQTPPGRRR